MGRRVRGQRRAMVRQLTTDPGSATQCQVTIAAVKAYGGGFPEFTLEVRAVGRGLAQVAKRADATYRAHFIALRQFMAAQKDAADDAVRDR